MGLYMNVFPCIMLTPFEPWFVVVLLITVCCTDSVDLSLWSGWLLSCFSCPFSRVCGRFADVSSDLSPHTPKSAQICLRWLNRRKTAPVAFPARTTMPSGKLWTSSEFPEGCSAHLELRTESGERRGMITLWAENREDSTQQRLPWSWRKNLWKSVASVWLCELRIIKSV